jgi:hypothetical protein
MGSFWKGEDGRELLAGDAQGTVANRAMTGRDIFERKHGAQAPGAVHTFVIAQGALPFEKCAPALDKLLASRKRRKLLLKLAVLVFRVGEFLLKIYVLLFERSLLAVQKR